MKEVVMNNSLQNQLTTQLSRDTVAQIAPDELLIFQVTSDEYFKNPEKTLKGQAEGDDMIGFGGGGVELFLTPIVLEVAATVVVPFLLEIAKETKEAFKEQFKDTVKQKSSNLFSKFIKFVKALFQPPQPPAEPAIQKIPSLTIEQVEQLTKLAFESAHQLGLDGVAAMKLAEALVNNVNTLAVSG